MNRSTFRAVAVGAALGVLVGAGGPHAYAAVVASDIKYFQTNTVDYQNRALMYDSSDSTTILGRNSHGDASPGKLGARARVYWDSGTLCSASVTRYNSNATDYFTVTFDSNCGGYIYSKGFTETWSGDGYERVQTFRTVNIGPL
ncbi:hypothetical protein [Nocardioides ferulae]|uniref:hypothetical protein n=1 Tax=Nocardioides ferulae TaxID=2340821 RepID=UPI000F889CAA|nr:hypothetical protein [Nocardioides ferulae]